MGHLYNMRGMSGLPSPNQNFLMDLKQHILKALLKLNDRDTQRKGAHELERIALEMPYEGIPVFLTCLYETDTKQKTSARKECIRMFGVLAQYHGDLLIPHLVKMVAAVIRRFKDTDSGINQACAAALGTMAGNLGAGEGDMDDAERQPISGYFFKPLLDALSEQNKNAQVAAVLCLDKVMQNTTESLEESISRLLPRFLKTLSRPNFLAKGPLISAIGTLTEVTGDAMIDYLPTIMPAFQNALSNADWITRKAAAETLGHIVVRLGAVAFVHYKAATLAALESCRSDKVKPVRECALKAFQMWQDVPGPAVARRPIQSPSRAAMVADRSPAPSPSAGSPRNLTKAFASPSEKSSRPMPVPVLTRTRSNSNTPSVEVTFSPPPRLPLPQSSMSPLRTSERQSFVALRSREMEGDIPSTSQSKGKLTERNDTKTLDSLPLKRQSLARLVKENRRRLKQMQAGADTGTSWQVEIAVSGEKEATLVVLKDDDLEESEETAACLGAEALRMRNGNGEPLGSQKSGSKLEAVSLISNSVDLVDFGTAKIGQVKDATKEAMVTHSTSNGSGTTNTSIVERAPKQIKQDGGGANEHLVKCYENTSVVGDGELAEFRQFISHKSQEEEFETGRANWPADEERTIAEHQGNNEDNLRTAAMVFSSSVQGGVPVYDKITLKEQQRTPLHGFDHHVPVVEDPVSNMNEFLEVEKLISGRPVDTVEQGEDQSYDLRLSSESEVADLQSGRTLSINGGSLKSGASASRTESEPPSVAVNGSQESLGGISGSGPEDESELPPTTGSEENLDGGRPEWSFDEVAVLKSIENLRQLAAGVRSASERHRGVWQDTRSLRDSRYDALSEGSEGEENEPTNGQPDILGLSEQLIQMERQQGRLVDVMQAFVGNTQDTLKNIENRMHSLERTVEGMTTELARWRGSHTIAPNASSLGSSRSDFQSAGPSNSELQGGQVAIEVQSGNVLLQSPSMRALSAPTPHAELSSRQNASNMLLSAGGTNALPNDTRLSLGTSTTQVGVASAQDSMADRPHAASDSVQYRATADVSSSDSLDEKMLKDIQASRGGPEGSLADDIAESFRSSLDSRLQEDFDWAEEERSGEGPADDSEGEPPAEEDYAGSGSKTEEKVDLAAWSWSNAAELLRLGNVDEAYKKGVRTRDMSILVRLMGRTGPRLGELQQQTAVEVLRSLLTLLERNEHMDYVLPWMRQLVELALDDEAGDLDLSWEMKVHTVSTLRAHSQAASINWTGQMAGQLAEKLLSVWMS